MSIRHLALYLVVAGLSIYAWKDWFKSLCGLILMMAVMENENMPRTILGIQGLNVWNVLFCVVFVAWIASRRRERLRWDMPRYVTFLLLMYLGVILVGVLRAALDRSHLDGYPLRSLINEELINTLKWALPGLLIFDGCRSRRRVIMTAVCVLAMYSLIAVQVARRLPPGSILYASAEINRTRQACQTIGYSACDMSAMLAGVSWAILAMLVLVRKKKHQVIALVVAGIVAYGQALTGGRAGYLAWGATGLVLCLLKWRKYLIPAPALVILLPIIFPGAVGRMLEGLGETDAAGQVVMNSYSMTSGRTLIWPYVIQKIGESPVVGYGRVAMKRTGVADRLMTESNESFPHPHNIYLETLLDNGILGSVPILLFWGMVVVYSARLFRSNNSLYSATGGLALCLTLAQLFAGVGSQHFYPEESTLGMWVAMFLALRVHVEEKRLQTGVTASENWSRPMLEQPRTASAPICT